MSRFDAVSVPTAGYSRVVLSKMYLICLQGISTGQSQRIFPPYLSKSCELSTFPSLNGSNLQKRPFLMRTTCPESPVSPSRAYVTLQSFPPVPGTRQQSNIHLETHPVRIKRDGGIYAAENVPPGVHAEGMIFGTFWRDLTQLELLSKEHRSPDQVCSPGLRGLRQSRRLILESI